MSAIIRCNEIDVEQLPEHSKTQLRVETISNSAGDFITIPVIVLKGAHSKPVMGITAAIHGNELNGISVIHQLIKEISLEKLQGTLICVPVVNIPGFILGRREFSNGEDLNRIMPGKFSGSSAEKYAFYIKKKLLSCFDYLIDLHTASAGRVNSLYVRADLSQQIPNTMAHLMHPEIILDNHDNEGTLRQTAMKMNIPAITVEVGNPQTFQRNLIDASTEGILDVLKSLNFLKGALRSFQEPSIICKKSFWLHTEKGGLLEVFPKLTEKVQRSQIIAVQTNLFGKVVKTYTAPEDGIVVGKSMNPVAEVGERILHLGLLN